MKNKELTNLYYEIGLKLADLRLKSGYETINKFAAVNRLPYIHYCLIESGKRNPTIKTLHRLALIHGVTVKDLLP